MNRSCLIFVAVVFTALSASACATGPKLAPKVSSSETSIYYAVEAPLRLAALTERLGKGRQQVTEAMGAFEAFPGEYKTPPNELVQKILEEADEAGRRHDVVEQIRQHQRIGAFIDAHSKEMSWQLNSSVASAAKKEACNCGSNLGGGLQYSLKKATRNELDKAHRSRNQAHALITARSGELGKHNTRTLRDQVDVITFTSFFVFIDSIDTLIAINQLLDEADDLRDTLEESIEADQKIIDEGKASRGARKDAQKRIDEAKASLQVLDASIKPAEKVSKAAEKDTEKLQKAYEEAFEKLVDKLE